MTTQEQLIHLHHLSLQEAELKQKIADLNREQDDLARSLCQNLPQDQWIWVSDEIIASVKPFNYVAGDNVDRGTLIFKDLKRITD